MSDVEKRYVTVQMPIPLMKEVDAIVTDGSHGYRSRNEFCVDAVRTLARDFKNNTNQNYQPPESGEERTIQGDNENEQMDTTERPNTRIDSVRLSVDQGEQEPADESRVEDPTKKVESRDGEDDPTS